MRIQTPLRIAGYEPAFDGLRGCAVASVVVFHACRDGAYFLRGGWIGVDIFFVLSGYLITNLLAREIDYSGTIDLKKFYMRRILRLTPALWAVLAFTIVAVLAFSSSRAENLGAALVSGLYLMNWFKAFGLPHGGYLLHTWSLSMEEQFYVIWPFALLFIIHRQPLRWITVTIFIVVLWRNYLAFSGVDPERTYAGFDTHADAILIGCALALTPISAETAARARIFAVLPVTGMILMLAEAGRRSFFTQTVGLTLAYLLAAWLIVIALQPGLIRNTLSLWPLVYTGRISYGWYLWHFPILVAGNLILVKMHLPQNAVVAFTAALVLVTYLISACSYRFIEQPFLRLKLRFEPKRMPTQRTGPVAADPASGAA